MFSEDDANTKIVTHYYNNAPRAQVHDSSNDDYKTRDG